MIKITKKLAGDRLYLSDTYISNGHWAIPRTAIDPRLNSIDALGTIVSTARTMEETAMRRAIAPGTETIRTWTVTPWIFDGVSDAGPLRVAVAADGTRLVMSDAYCRMLGIAAGETVCAIDDRTVVRVGVGEDARYLMPVRADILQELPAAPVVP